MSPLKRAAAVAVALLVALGVAVVVFGIGADRVGVASPSPTDGLSPTGEPSGSASAEPTPANSDEALAAFAEIEEQVLAIRGLEPAEIGPPELISREDLVAELQRIFDEDYPETERREDNITLRAMGLLEPDQDVAELQLQLLGDQVLGFYDDTEQRMVVVSDAGITAEAKITYAHEYTHALQDAAFGLDSLQPDAEGADDRGLARLSLVEGDATLSMFTWALNGGLTQDELLGMVTGPVPDMSGIPSWMSATLLFPYEAGLEWTLAVAGGEAAIFNPDFAAVDAAFADPPESTEQILHLDKWTAREAPVAVDAPELASALGDGWTEVESTPVGEATIAIMLEYLGASADEAGDAAAGWGGDRIVVASGPDDAFALAWVLAWDTPADANAFEAAYGSIADGLAFPAAVSALPSGDLLVVHASSDALLQMATRAAGG